VQGFEGKTPLCLALWLSRYVSMGSGTSIDRPCMRVACSAINATLIDKKITGGIIFKNGVEWICRDGLMYKTFP
jgi:hypothetical protein